MAKKSYIKVVENDNKTVTFSFEMHIWYVVTKLDVNYFENNKEIRKEIEIFSFEIVDVSADYIVIRTNNPMSIIDNNRINLLSKETEFKVMRNEKLLLSTLTTDRSYKYEISIVDEPGKVIEKDKEKLSYGIYVDTNDLNSIKRFSLNYINKYGDDPNNFAIRKDIEMPNPEKEATDWIINNKNFEVLKEVVNIQHGDNHDEPFYTETIEYEKKFYYYLPKFVLDSTINFICKKDNEEFILSPTSSIIEINNVSYEMPIIEVYDYNMEKLGIENINTLK
ncbi:MAG TPA: hypothetical protein IAB38_07525 [Candidatus Onthousia excrementipullorum]|uniref:Uncharacterized protein n=1 Tax=Candidatus Onthousia excrementipullorum TaxID=2840884 RepID=A0A9D1DVY8_9FIRM|nr:hypothetical protein [Candidatus Onthousia excrementipullorum]